MTILESIAESFECTKTEAKGTINKINEGILKCLKSDGAVRIPGLGSFRIKRTPARNAYHGMNRFTHQEQDFAAKPAQNKLKFSASKEIKEQISKFKAR